MKERLKRIWKDYWFVICMVGSFGPIAILAQRHAAANPPANKVGPNMYLVEVKGHDYIKTLGTGWSESATLTHAEHCWCKEER